MSGHRPSALNTAELCGLSAILGAKHGAGRAAACGTAFHALCEGQEPVDNGDTVLIAGQALTA